MKKKCISTNNAKSIDESVTCSQELICPQPVAVNSCTNPIEYILEQALTDAINTNVAVDTVLLALLTAGVVLDTNATNNVGFCCPAANGCSTGGSGALSSVYVLSSMAPFLVLAGASGLQWGAGYNSPLPVSVNRPCCISVKASNAQYLNYTNIMEILGWSVSSLNIPAPNCCNKKNETVCLETLNPYISQTALLILGLVEVNGFLDSTSSYLESQICILSSFIEKVLDTHYFLTTPAAFIISLLNAGIAVFCCGCHIFIGNTAQLVLFQNSPAIYPNGCNIINNYNNG